jgi:hypothetical protein
MTRGEELGRFQRLAAEAAVFQRDTVWEHLTEVYLAALQHGQNFKTTPLRDSYLHIRIALRVAVQELRKHAFDVEWRGSHFQHTDVTATEVLRPLAEPGGVIQQTTAIAEQLLAFPSQQEATSDTIEQLENRVPARDR